MINNTITIFTPTFNRIHLLPRLYESIKVQKFNNFEWLIVDDGSSDGTNELVSKYIEENQVDIKYFRKENGGKHTAINFGVQKARGDLFLIVDSDDILAENTLKMLSQKFLEIRNNDKIAGIIGLSAYFDGKIVGTRFLQNKWQVSFCDVYLKFRVKGDKLVAFKTEILKKFPFPESPGVQFVFEAVVWHEMAKKYDVIAMNKIFQIVEYQNEGVSNCSYKRWYLKSLAYSYYQLIENKTYPFSKYPKSFMWNYINLAINSKLSGVDYFSKLNLKDKILYIIFYPRAFYSYRNMKKKLLTND